MELLSETLVTLAAAVLGLSTGALLTEGAVLVPFWRSQAPEAFLGWYREHAGLLLRFFGPLEITAALLALAAFTANLWQRVASAWLLGAAALLSIAVLALFPVYFQATNARFAAGAIEPGRVGDELHRWAAWHRARTLIAAGAFVAVLVALALGRPDPVG